MKSGRSGGSCIPRDRGEGGKSLPYVTATCEPDQSASSPCDRAGRLTIRRRNWHPVELLPTAEEVDDYSAEQEAQQAERIPVMLTPVQRQAEDAERIRRLRSPARQADDAERIRRSELTPVQREVEDAARRSQSLRSQRQPPRAQRPPSGRQWA